MGTTYYHYKNETSEQIQGLTEIIPTITPRIALIIGHGIGERNSGDLAGCKLSSGWPGWGTIKALADKYGVLQVYINTSHDYEFKEYQFAVDWVLKHYPHLKDNIWILGHSLGSFGFGKYGATDETLMSKIAGWIDSASGNFGDIAEVYKNIIDNNVKWWGVTALNDKASQTDPIAVQRVYDKVKALKPDAPMILTVFPETEWPTPAGATGSKTAHNAVLGRLTQAPMYYSKGNIGLITKGIPSQQIKMNLYEWMISNPRGSIYQDPTLAFTGPKYAEQPAPAPTPIPEPPTPSPEPAPQPTPTPVYLDKIYVEGTSSGKSLTAELIWTDGQKQVIKAPVGATIQYVIPELVTLDGKDRKAFRVKYSNKTTSTLYGPRK